MPWKIGLSSPLITGRLGRFETTASNSAGTASFTVKLAFPDLLNSPTREGTCSSGAETSAPDKPTRLGPLENGVSKSKRLLRKSENSGKVFGDSYRRPYPAGSQK